MIVPRDPDVDLSGVPRAWVANNAAATAISNGVNLLFPHGERFFVRSVKRYLEQIQIEDPELAADIKGFFGQEGRHARAHDDFNDVLRAQGYEIDRFLATYKKLTNWLEARMSGPSRLAVTAAAEHFTATLAQGAFEYKILDACDPRMQKLLAWHAAEEIEHKSVAYDVLQHIDPSYRTRVLGLAVATLTLGGFWLWGASMLIAQDGLSWRQAIRQLRSLPRRDPVIRRVFVRGIRQYLRRDFHPDKIDNRNLAAAWFAERGISFPEAA